MPLTSLLYTALDQVSHEPKYTKDNVMKYFMNDTLCYLDEVREGLSGGGELFEDTGDEM